MKFGSLFTGIGGFDLGFERAGMTCAWQCEIDKHARAVLAKHWPGVPCYDDVRGITGGTVPRVDLICGGFPCQDVSVAGRRTGLAGERSGLWFEFHRVLAELQPEWVVIENVPGLLSSWSGDSPGSMGIEAGPQARPVEVEEGSDFATVLSGLAELGYMGSFWSPDAQWFGVAQRRERVFIVGHLGDGRACEVLPLPEGMCGNPPSRGTAREDVAGTLGGGLGRGSSGGPRNDLDGHGAYVVDTLTVGANQYSGFHGEPVVSIQDTREMEKAQNGLGVSEAGVGYTLDGTGAQGVYVPDVVGALNNGAHNGGGLNGQDAYSGRIFSAAGRPRRLTPTECERLQGFPDGWTAGQSDTHRYKQLGNAVAVPVAEWIGRRIMATENPAGERGSDSCRSASSVSGGRR